MAEVSRCSICGESTREAFRATVLGRHPAQYRFCAACGYLHAEQPYWLEEAYTAAIARADTGLVVRNLDIARLLSGIAYTYCERDGRFLDLAGGTGLLTRLMRDIGFDFYWEDEYCQNLMAPGFEAAAGAGYEAVTAFEALEHMTDPLAFVEAAVARSRTGTLIFTTELFKDTPPAADWWYYAFPTGQHISFFTHQTLEVLGRRLGLKLYSASGMHMLTRKNIANWHYAWTVKNAKRGWLYGKVCRAMRSRTQADHELMLKSPK